VSYPFYVILKDGWWMVIASPLKRDIRHTTLWELIVARMVAIENCLNYNDIKNLPYSQIRGRVVDNVIYYGDEFTAEQKEVIKNTLGQFVYVYDEHEKMTEYDIEVFNSLKNKACG